MLKLIKRVRQEMKKEAELHRSMKRLARIPLDYEALQMMINATANNYNSVELTVTLTDGTTVTLKPLNNNGTNYISFKDRYDARK